MRVSPPLAVLLLLAACATRDGLPQGTGAVRSVPKQDTAAPVARGEVSLAVRSFGLDGQEFAGAVCEADSRYFTADVISPGRILMPYFGEASPQITVTCRSGALSGQTIVAAVPSTQGGGVAWPSVGVSVNSNGGVGVGMGLGYYGGRSGSSASAYAYPPANVVMR